MTTITHDGTSVREFAGSPQECAAAMKAFGIPIDDPSDSEIWQGPHGKRGTIETAPCPCGCGDSLWLFKGWSVH